MVPGEKSKSSSSSISSKLSNDDLDDVSISSSEFAAEIKNKVKFTLKDRHPICAESDPDSDANDIILDGVYDYYDVMTPYEKMAAIKARTKAMKKK